MKTYAQTSGSKTFNWNSFLSQKKRDITDKAWKHAAKRSSNWVSCACGNQCDSIPRDSEGIPHDYFLQMLGADFHHFIVMRNLKDARRVLKDIEGRSEYILREAANETTTN